MIQLLLFFFRMLYCLYAFLMFTLLLLCISPGVLAATLMRQPKSGALIIKLCTLWSDVWLWLIGIRHRNIMVSPIEAQQHYVFVANHQSYLDIPLIFQVIRHNQFRVLGKAEMARIPLFGILYRLAVVLVDRSSPEKRARSVATLKSVVAQNISILIFPEGTFNETQAPLKFFYDGAFRVALETNTNIKPIVFLDSQQRMHHQSVWKLNPGPSRAVILPEVSIEGLKMEDLPKLKQEVFTLMESALLEYRKQNDHTNR
jgi:1-acyl-sn-glycerol-3-phosphate acyltransferase